MDFTVDFFKDEVRNGFYIPTAVKQAWAANLCVLSEIDRICEKYGITYFADWGSMLGAVRHGGYVPWDDDLDICMKRKDYNRFREVADKELPEEFAIHDFRSKEDHWLFLARVVNSNQICFEENHLQKYHNFPYISVVDIFIKDYLYRDEKKEKERCAEIKRLLAVADGIVENSFSDETVSREITAIERSYSVVIDRNLSPRDIGMIIYGIAEEQMARVKEEEADNIGQMFPFVLKGDRGLPKEYYDKAIRLPFENTTMPVPERYNEMLKNRYGNYLEIHKVWGGHNYPYFEGQKKNLQAVADFSLPEFTFNSDMLKSFDRAKGRGDSLVDLSHGFIEQLESLNENIVELYEEESYAEVRDIMPDVQQFVVDYATLVENVKGEERKCCQQVVASIQEYCDVLYAIYLVIDKSEMLTHDDKLIKRLTDALDSIVRNVNENIINRKEILFLPIGEKEWAVFDKIYRDYAECDEYDVYVVPIPVFFKDIYGRVKISGNKVEDAIDYEKYPGHLVIDSWMDYNTQLHRPDIIYIQNPYDGENPCLTVPAQFYAVNIRQYTDKLIYIPPFNTGEFGPDDHNDIYNMKHYVTAPGVVYADEVLVQSENIRLRYVDKLSEFAGEDTRTIWDKRIKNVGDDDELLYDQNGIMSYDRQKGNDRKKRILYCIGLNEISEHKSDFTDSIKDRINTFNAESKKIDVGVILFPAFGEIWNEVDGEETGKLQQMIAACVDRGWRYIDWCVDLDYSDIVDDYDAYYGSASPLVTIFSQEKKPVMIADYNF